MYLDTTEKSVDFRKHVMALCRFTPKINIPALQPNMFKPEPLIEQY